MLGLFKYTEKSLAQDIIKLIKQHYDSPICDYKPESREVVFREAKDSEDNNMIIFLGNIYNKVKDLKKQERQASINSFMSSILQREEFDPEKMLASLCLRARTPFELSIRDLYSEKHNHGAIESVIYGEGEVFFELVADSEETVAIVIEADLPKANVSKEEAYKIAASRLHRMTDARQWAKVNDCVWVSAYQDDYDFSRLLANKLNNQFPFGDQPIIFAPSQSICLVSNSQDPQKLELLINYGNELAKEHRPFSQLLWTHQNDGEIVRLAKDHMPAISDTIRLQYIREMASQYDEQKVILTDMLDARNDDIFIATYDARAKDNVLVTYCVYSIDVPSYLPKTEQVVIVDPFDKNEQDNIWGHLLWDDFVAIADNNISKLENAMPDCYALLTPLSDEQKQQLKQRAF